MKKKPYSRGSIPLCRFLHRFVVAGRLTLCGSAWTLDLEEALLRTRGIDDRAAANRAWCSRRLLAVSLAVGLSIVAVPSTHPANAATVEPTGVQVDEPGPRIVWLRSVEADGNPMFPDGSLEPIAVAWRPEGLILLAENAAAAAQLWRSTDGIAWVRLPSLPGSDAHTSVRDVVAFTKGWLVHGEDAAGNIAMWTSIDGVEWRRVADAKLELFAGTSTTDIVAGGDGLVALGRRSDGSKTDGLWISPDGRRWRRRHLFAGEYPGASIKAMGAMGHHFVSFGRTSTGKPTSWIALNSSINETTRRKWRGSVSGGPSVPTSLYVGRDGGFAVTPAASLDDPPPAWHSVNAWDWQRLPATGQPATGSGTAFASDGDLIISDRVATDGGHTISVSVDGRTWQDIESVGDVPRTAAPPIIAAQPSGLVLISDEGIWHGAWVDRASAIPPRPSYAQPEVGPIGADPPLRDPVGRPKGQKPVLDTSGRPTARKERGGVRLEHWLPTGAIRSGHWLPAHVRITNAGTRTIRFSCAGAYTRARTAELFPHGKQWSGNAAAFKERVLEREWPGNLGFGRRRGDGTDCPVGVGDDIDLAPGAVYEYDVWSVPRYPIGDQPLPSGRLPVVTTFSYDRGEGADRLELVLRSHVKLAGPRWRWATPQKMVDAMLEDPRFRDWLDRRDRPIWWDNPTFHVVGKRDHYWRDLGFEGPAPDGTVHIGLFAHSWTDFGGGYGRMLLDPWTGQVLGFAT
jgi:hypothetical protein